MAAICRVFGQRHVKISENIVKINDLRELFVNFREIADRPGKGRTRTCGDENVGKADAFSARL